MSNEQRTSQSDDQLLDDTQGHGFKARDPEKVDGQEPAEDDTEGHGKSARFFVSPTEAPEGDDDTEGHMPLRARIGNQEPADDDADAEGHGFRARVGNEEPAEDDDTEGHAAKFRPDTAIVADDVLDRNRGPKPPVK